MRTCWRTDSGITVSEPELLPYITLPSRHSPINPAVTTGAGPVSAGGRSIPVFSGNRQSFLTDGTTTCTRMKPPITVMKAGAPFGRRRVAQARKVQPSSDDAVFANLPSCNQQKPQASKANNAGQAFTSGLD